MKEELYLEKSLDYFKSEAKNIARVKEELSSEKKNRVNLLLSTTNLVLVILLLYVTFLTSQTQFQSLNVDILGKANDKVAVLVNNPIFNPNQTDPTLQKAAVDNTVSWLNLVNVYAKANMASAAIFPLALQSIALVCGIVVIVFAYLEWRHRKETSIASNKLSEINSIIKYANLLSVEMVQAKPDHITQSFRALMNLPIEKHAEYLQAIKHVANELRAKRVQTSASS